MVDGEQNNPCWPVHRLVLSRQEETDVCALIDTISSNFDFSESEEFLSAAPTLSLALPRSIRAFLTEAHYGENWPAYLISAPSLAANFGPTPPNWWSANRASTRHVEFALILLSSILGEVFSWATQQDGRLIHDVMPIAGKEHEQLGCGSITPLSFHTEDAFHPFRGDYVGIACLRNVDLVPTTLIAVDDLQISPAAWECLSGPRFIINPDNSHFPHNNTRYLDQFDSVYSMLAKPTPAPVIFGDPERPYLRVDPDFMAAVPGDEAASEVLAVFLDDIAQQLREVVLVPGDFLFIDNFRCAHGRRSFRPRYDGLDRWIKRVNISRNLRAARAAGACVKKRQMV